MRSLLWFAVFFAFSPLLAAKPAAVIPARADIVLEVLPRGYAALTPALKPAAISITQVHRLLNIAAATGDARLVARADAMLRRFPDASRSPEVLRARAYSAQHRHDFPTALRLLDQLIKTSPRDGDARMARAQIQLVQGRLRAARADCAALAFGIDSGRALLCVAALSLRIGKLDAAASTVDRWLAQTPNSDPSRRHGMLLRAEIASRAGSKDASMRFQQALRGAPADVRTLAAYARHLRGLARHRDVLVLLANAPDTDGLALERTLASHAAGTPAAPAFARAQARRFAMARALGSPPEIRDEAEFLLSVRGDATGALRLALENFREQRDHEDVLLLQRAAHAARRPAALAALRAWAAAEQISLEPTAESPR